MCVNFKSKDTIEVISALNEIKTFTFDRVFDTESTQTEIFNNIAKPLINDVLKGYNATMFTYGQSGSGKTYTMYGEEIFDQEYRGIIPRSITEIFNFIKDEKNQNIKFELKFSMLEIYMENLYDLLNPYVKSNELKIKEHNKLGIYVENLSEIYITSQEEFLYLINEAEKCRSVSETSLNKCSSRSHLLFQLQITQKLQDDTERRGFLNLIDLAGSEKVSKTHAMGITLEEAKKINLSLSNLGNVIYALANNSDYIPYRDSKLTRILQDSLGGNSKTLLIVNCSVHSYNAEETISTLLFAKRAKKINNKVKMNIKRSSEQLEAIIEYLKAKLENANREIERLKRNATTSLYKRQVESLNIFKEEIFNKTLKEIKSENFFDEFKNDFNIHDIDFTINSKNHFELISENKRKNSNIIDRVENTDLYLKIIDNNNTLEIEKEKNITNFNEINIPFTSPNKGSENLIDREKLEYENKLKIKNFEIETLSLDIENLKQENNLLKEKVEIILKDNNIEKCIFQLEKSMREFIKDLSISYDNIKDTELKLLKENLVEVKSYQIEMENKYLEIIKEITEFKEVDFNEKLHFLNPKYLNKTDNQSYMNNSNKFKTLNGNNRSFINNTSMDQKVLTNQNNNENIEKEITIFDNFDDELNISINTCNKIAFKNPLSSKNILKLTLKRNPDEFNTNKNVFNETINNTNNININSNSHRNNNNNFLLMNEKNKIPRDKSFNKTLINTNIIDELKSRNDKLFNSNSINKINSSNQQLTDITNKNLNINENNIKVIENFTNFYSENKENYLDTNSRIKNINSDNFWNRIQINSNEKTLEKLNTNLNINTNDNLNLNTNKKILSNNYEFKLSCEKLFEKIENNLKKINGINHIIADESQNNNNTEKHLTTSKGKNINEGIGNLLKENNKNIYKNFQPSQLFEKNEKSNLDILSNNSYIGTTIKSYKKIFEKNQFYTKKILDEFLKNSELELVDNNKMEENQENINLYNFKNKYFEDNKSFNKNIDKRSDNNLHNNLNLLLNNSTLQEDYFSVNDKIDRRYNLKNLNEIENPNTKIPHTFILNKNNNNELDNNINEEIKNFGNDSSIILKLKNGFVNLMLRNIYYEKITYELLTRLSLDLSIFIEKI